MKHIRKWKAQSGKKFMRVRGHGKVTGQTRRALKTRRRYIAPQARSWNWIEVSCRKEVPYSVFFLLSCWILVFGTLVTLFPDRLVQGRAEKLTLTPWKELDSILFVIQICTLLVKAALIFPQFLGWFVFSHPALEILLFLSLLLLIKILENLVFPCFLIFVFSVSDTLGNLL